MVTCLLILLYNSISAHQSKNAPFFLIKSCRFALSEEGSQVLGFYWHELISLGVEVDLKFVDLVQVNFKVIDINFGHYLTIVVTQFSICLD